MAHPLVTSESVTEGHPDKVADYIADSVLDAYLEIDPASRVACEVLCKGSRVVVAGEITSKAEVQLDAVVRGAIRDVGYTEPGERFHADSVAIEHALTPQSPEIDAGVSPAERNGTEQGAGDQGLMYGYASDETPELMPLPILLAHRLTAGLTQDRKAGDLNWLRPDGKAQVTVRYEGLKPVAVEQVVVSTQHQDLVNHETIHQYVTSTLGPRSLEGWHNNDIKWHVNPTGSFVEGGPAVDCGVTGRKIIVDTYGGAARHGGGAFSGKDPSKVDRSAAYFSRFVAREIVKSGIAQRAEIQVAYAIGVAGPLHVSVDTFGTGSQAAAEEALARYDFRPAAIIERLALRQPIYRQTTNYGHFGRPQLNWEV
jgi:S-adenosylmethionine synthetase